VTEGLGSRVNLRDLGGLDAGGGRVFRHGVLIRSEALLRFSEADLEALGERGVKLVCDLRAPAERAGAPTPWSAAHPRPAVLELPLWGDEGPEHPFTRSHAGDEEAFRGVLTAVYRTMPGALERTGGLATLVDRLIAGETPVLVHCSQGKDRTGVIVALICAACGVDWDTIVEDYLLTNDFYDRDLASRQTAAALVGPGEPVAELDPDTARSLDASVAYLEATWEAIEADYGSLDRYLESAARLDAERRRELRDALTEPRPA
jgi:protein-tyrosine phosphatase